MIVSRAYRTQYITLGYGFDRASSATFVVLKEGWFTLLRNFGHGSWFRRFDESILFFFQDDLRNMRKVSEMFLGEGDRSE